MKKIGLTTIYSVPNYGSVLQAYATQEVLKKLGFDCHIINYKYPNLWHYSVGFQKPKIKSIFMQFLGIRSIHRKQKKLQTFKNRYFNLTKEYCTLDDLRKENWNEYDLVATGSDQIWNSRFLKGDSAFMLSYLPDNIKRISIASSFASKSLPSQYIDKYKKYLSKFDALSVREQNGICIINNELSIKKDVKIILDPTLLLSKEEWLNLIPRSKFRKEDKYILFYMWDYAFDPKPYIFKILAYLVEKYKYKVIALEGYKKKKEACGVDMIDKTDASVNEFIDLFANADMVITSSFHGTAFALNFGKPLISIIPNDKGDDRQSTLLTNLGITQCIIPINTELQQINPNYDTIQEQNILEQLRLDSTNWIKNNINCV